MVLGVLGVIIRRGAGPSEVLAKRRLWEGGSRLEKAKGSQGFLGFPGYSFVLQGGRTSMGIGRRCVLL
jgi:hypothetical protein